MARDVLIGKVKAEQNLREVKEKIASILWKNFPGTENIQIQWLKATNYLIFSRAGMAVRGEEPGHGTLTLSYYSFCIFNDFLFFGVAIIFKS